MSSRQSAKDAKLQNLGRMIREPTLRWAWHSHAADRKKKRVVNSRRRRSLRKQMYGFAIKKFGRALRLADWDFETLETKPLCETQRPLRSEEHTSELQSRLHLVCRLLLEKKKKNK